MVSRCIITDTAPALLFVSSLCLSSLRSPQAIGARLHRPLRYNATEMADQTTFYDYYYYKVKNKLLINTTVDKASGVSNQTI